MKVSFMKRPVRLACVSSVAALLALPVCPAIGAGHAATSEPLSISGRALECPAPLFDSKEAAAMREQALKPDSPFDTEQFLRTLPAEAKKAFDTWQTSQMKTDWAGLCKYREENRKLRESRQPVGVVFMGDSITENWAAADPTTFTGKLVGRGISGQTSTQMVARFHADVVSLHPQAVHILAGTNDLSENTGSITADEYLGNIAAMMDMAKANGIRVILGSIPPVDKFPNKPDVHPAPLVAALNGQLRALARERGAQFIDYYSALASPTGGMRQDLSNDGIHPTRRGYSIMLPILTKAIDAPGRARR